MKNSPGPPMTLGNMRDISAREVTACARFKVNAARISAWTATAPVCGLGAGGFFGGNASASRSDTRTLHKETSKPARSLAPRSTRAPCRQVTALGARRCKRGHGSVADLVAPCTGAPFAKVGRRKAARGAGHIIAQGMSCG